MTPIIADILEYAGVLEAFRQELSGLKQDEDGVLSADYIEERHLSVLHDIVYKIVDLFGRVNARSDTLTFEAMQVFVMSADCSFNDIRCDFGSFSLTMVRTAKKICTFISQLLPEVSDDTWKRNLKTARRLLRGCIHETTGLVSLPGGCVYFRVPKRLGGGTGRFKMVKDVG